MQRQDKIYIAGHQGMVGSAIHRCLAGKGYQNIVTRSRAQLDLCRQAEVEHFFEQEHPEHVFVAAAKVGGILANSTRGAEFIRENLAISTNIIHAAYQTGVKKLLYLGSSCIYPKFATQPMSEDCLLSGPLEPTNEPYAVAKIAGIKMCAAYNRQYGTDYLAVMPTNLYGPGDNYDLGTSHVVAALIRKMHEAKINQHAAVTVWGTGTPKREFLYSDDLADACVFLMENHHAREIGEVINVGTGKDMSIMELAQLIAEIVGYSGSLEFDASKPDGTPRKLLDVSRMSRLGWTAKTRVDEGIAMAYRHFQEQV